MLFLIVIIQVWKVWSFQQYRSTDVIRSISSSTLFSTASSTLSIAPFDDVIPFLSEHIQPSDQMLFVGASTDFALQLARAGYGTKKTGFMIVIDSNEKYIEECIRIAQTDSLLQPLLVEGKLKFKVVDYSSMSDVCRQSVYDSIVDYGGLDTLHDEIDPTTRKNNLLKCIDQLQNAVRLGNILVCISKLDKSTFCSPFQEWFGWVQELDGDPGEISAWYRGKTNIQASVSNFYKYGLKMYVYTNTDNC